VKTGLVLGAALLAAAWPATSAADQDVWARVPPLPTGCYQSDGFAAKIETADAAVRADIQRQDAINKQLQEQVRSIDPMELASRQQQYMMDNPQEAMALMKRNAALGTQEASDDRLQDIEDQRKLLQSLEEIDARYKAALDAQFAPVEAKFKELDVRAQKDLELTEAGGFYKPWAIKEWNALNAQRNAAYERVCAEWWAASGPFRGWLQRYRDYAAGLIPKHEEMDAVGAGFMVIVVGTPKASFKSTAALNEVDDYMGQAAKVFAKRWEAPRPDAEGVEDGRPALK